MTNNTCNFYLDDLTEESSLHASANIFFELFLQDNNGNLIDVPALVRNYNNSGSVPNSGPIDQWKLTRRFVVYDTLSGITD